MARRYSDVKRGAKLNTALNNYINYLQTAGTRPSRIGSQGPRDLSQLLYFAPFTITVDADEVVQGRCSTDSKAKLMAVVNTATGAAVADAIGANALIGIPKFKAARIVYFENSTRAVTVQSSDVTGLQYLKYAGERFSIPFGAQTATADQTDAFLASKAAILTANAAAAVKRVGLQREYVGVEVA